MLALFTVVTTLSAASPLSAQDAPPPDGNRLVKVALVADRDAIRPGDRFQIGVHLRIEPGWHVYWENSGDSGIPTTAKISAPSDYKVGPLRFPAPERHELEGEIIDYVHYGDLLLVADVVAPDTGLSRAPSASASATVKFAVESRWLVCTEVCVAGSGKAELELPIAEKTTATKPANEKLFASSLARMPRPWNEIASSVDVTTADDEAGPVQKLRVRGATALEFFPYASKTTSLKERSIKVGPSGGTLELLWRFAPKEPSDRPETGGLLQVRTAAGEAFYAFDPAAADGDASR